MDVELKKVEVQVQKDKYAQMPKEQLIEQLMKSSGTAKKSEQKTPSMRGSQSGAKPASNAGWGSTKARSNAGNAWDKPASVKSNGGGWGASGQSKQGGGGWDSGNQGGGDNWGAQSKVAGWDGSDEDNTPVHGSGSNGQHPNPFQYRPNEQEIGAHNFDNVEQPQHLETHRYEPPQTPVHAPPRFPRVTVEGSPLPKAQPPPFPQLEPRTTAPYGPGNAQYEQAQLEHSRYPPAPSVEPESPLPDRPLFDYAAFGGAKDEQQKPEGPGWQGGARFGRNSPVTEEAVTIIELGEDGRSLPGAWGP